MKVLKKIRRFLGSMPLAITLLVLLAAACGIASAIPQNQAPEWYQTQYGERAGSLITGLHLDDTYHSLWFLILSGALCLSLLMCNLTRIRPLIRRTREAKEGKAGIWGAWVCHLGILLLVVGFAAGQMTHEDYTVTGLPGDTVPLGDTGLTVRIDDFSIDWQNDGSAGQYTADITVFDENGRTESGQSSVNHPASLFGFSFVQNSAGWAAEVTVRKDDEIIQQETLCTGEYIPFAADPDIYIQLLQFYPNYDGTTGVASPMASTYPEHPGYVVRLYDRFGVRGDLVLEKDQRMGLNREYSVSFDHPTNYTLLVANRDRFEWVVMAGAALILAGLVMAFYLKKR